MIPLFYDTTFFEKVNGFRSFLKLFFSNRHAVEDTNRRRNAGNEGAKDHQKNISHAPKPKDPDKRRKHKQGQKQIGCIPQRMRRVPTLLSMCCFFQHFHSLSVFLTSSAQKTAKRKQPRRRVVSRRKKAHRSQNTICEKS